MREQHAAQKAALDKKRAEDKARHKAYVEAKAAADSMQEVVRNQMSSLQQGVARSGTAGEARVAAFKAGAPSRRDISSGTGTPFFGIQANGALPELKPSTLTAVKVDSILQDLLSIAASSHAASSTDIELAKALSGCGFDGAPCAQVDRIAYPRPAQNPAVSDLVAHIPPAALQDQAVQQRLREYGSMEAYRQEKEQRLSEVSAQIKAGGENVDILKAYQSDLQHQAAQARKLEDDTVAEIKKQIVNDGLVWGK